MSGGDSPGEASFLYVLNFFNNGEAFVLWDDPTFHDPRDPDAFRLATYRAPVTPNEEHRHFAHFDSDTATIMATGIEVTGFNLVGVLRQTSRIVDRHHAMSDQDKTSPTSSVLSVRERAARTLIEVSYDSAQGRHGEWARFVADYGQYSEEVVRKMRVAYEAADALLAAGLLVPDGTPIKVMA